METEIQRLRRQADRAWEMAGLARKDRDRADEVRWTKEARELDRQIKELRNVS